MATPASRWPTTWPSPASPTAPWSRSGSTPGRWRGARRCARTRIGTVYATASSGGLYALDVSTGLVRWRTPFFDAAAPSTTGATGALSTDGERLFVAAADLGVYALDLDGNVLWRQGTRGGGEPAAPVVWGKLVIYSLARDGMYLADRRTGEIYEFFNPGEGTAVPTVTADGQLYVLSNRGVLYAFDLDDV